MINADDGMRQIGIYKPGGFTFGLGAEGIALPNAHSDHGDSRNEDAAESQRHQFGSNIHKSRAFDNQALSRNMTFRIRRPEIDT